MPAQSIRNSDSRSRLGRGLAALLGDAREDETPSEMAQGVTQVPIEFLRSSAKNPRQHFDDIGLDELASSIKLRGIIQPILVRPIAGVHDTFEIIAGERRWRAAQQAGLHTVPVIVLDVGDRDALELALIENVQRADLNALEEAAAYTRLAAEFGYNHMDIAGVVGKSRSHIANTLRLINLPTHTRELLSTGAISAGHGRALLSVSDPDATADKIVATGLTVRDVESLGRASRRGRKDEAAIENHDPDIKAVETKLALALGVQVQIKQIGQKYDFRMKVSDVEQLTAICDRLVTL